MVNVSETATMEQVKTVFDINFFGNFRVTREILPGMKKQRSGRIINISSSNGISCKLLIYPIILQVRVHGGTIPSPDPLAIAQSGI